MTTCASEPKKLILSQKAYQVDFSRIEEGYCYSEETCYAENHNKARTKLLKQVKYQSVCLWGETEEVTYTNIPVIRCQKYDLYHFEGGEKTEKQIEEIGRSRARTSFLDDLLADPKVTHCYIRKGGFYRPGNSGYTDYKQFAGVYTKEEAISEARSVENMKVIPIDIEVHNDMLRREAADLLSRVIE